MERVELKFDTIPTCYKYAVIHTEKKTLETNIVDGFYNVIDKETITDIKHFVSYFVDIDKAIKHKEICKSLNYDNVVIIDKQFKLYDYEDKI